MNGFTNRPAPDGDLVHVRQRARSQPEKPNQTSHEKRKSKESLDAGRRNRRLSVVRSPAWRRRRASTRQKALGYASGQFGKNHVGDRNESLPTINGFDEFFGNLYHLTSNTYWDWIMNHVPQVYQGMEEVPKFMASFKDFPPRSVPPSFNPATMMEAMLRDIKAKKALENAFPMLRKEAGR